MEESLERLGVDYIDVIQVIKIININQTEQNILLAEQRHQLGMHG